MPKLWTETIEAHRTTVADAIMDKTAELAAANGLHALTMAGIAHEVGIGRATLYKYFTDIDQILAQWHQREIGTHLAELERIRETSSTPLEALRDILVFYAGNARKGHDHALGAILHSLPHFRHAHAHLERLIADLIDEAKRAGEIRSTASAHELARFALAAIAASQGMSSKPALHRLVAMIMQGAGAVDFKVT